MLRIGKISRKRGNFSSSSKRLFTFQTTKNILFELGSSNKVGSLLKDMGIKKGQRILIVTDPGIITAKLDVSCINGLLNEGFEYDIYSKIVADPPSVVINDAVKFAKSKDIAGVIGLGGGSSMDVAKVVSFLSHKQCEQNIDNIYGVNQCIGNRLPLLQIPTTAGTGSEVTPISIVTTGSNEKKGIVSPVLLPDWAIIGTSIYIFIYLYIYLITQS
jgi:alcohol dehydrogenase class IV